MNIRQLFILCILSIFTCVNAETVTLQMQKANANYPTDTIQGKVFYIYEVKQSEGLYRISKNFGVSQEDIVKFNPELTVSGLRLGQTIRIPVYEQIDSVKYIVHELQPKETLFGLSRKYDVKMSQIQKLNPETAKRMNIGDKLLIRLKTEEELAAENVGNKKQFKKISPDSLALLLKDNDVKGDVVSRDSMRTLQRDTVRLMRKDTILTLAPIVMRINDSVEDEQISSNQGAEVRQTPIRLAYLLPFMSQTAKRDATTERFTEFYEGALLAINEEQSKGQRFEIYTYDTEKTDSKVIQILQNQELQNIDFIIGPAYPTQVSVVSKFAFEQHIPVLVPFTSKVSDLSRNPYLMQFNTTQEQEQNAVSEFLAQKGDTANLIVLSTVQVTADSIIGLLKSGQENYLQFPTERYAVIQPIVDELSQQKNNYDIRLIAQYSWAKENIPLRYVYPSVFHQVSQFDLAQNQYDLQYKYFFKNPIMNNHPRYDLLGYDVTKYIISLLQSEPEKTFEERVLDNDYVGLHSDIKFVKKGEKAGYENSAIMIIER